MSRLSKKAIEIPAEVTFEEKEGVFEFRGAKGVFSLKKLPYVQAILEEGKFIRVSALETSRQARANTGTMTALLKNALRGVHEGFSKSLDIEGVGFRAALEGDGITLSLGFSHPVHFTLPKGVEARIEKNSITVSGIDNGLVSQVAAQIRSLKKPEPYKGKGIRYRGEVIRRKVGKKAATAKA